MVSGYIMINNLTNLTLNGFFDMTIDLPKCSKVAYVKLSDTNGKFHTTISKGEFLQIIKNIQDVFSLKQIPNEKVYEGPDLIVTFNNGKTTNTFVNVNPKVTTASRITPAQVDVYSNITGYLVLLRSKFFGN